MSCHSLSTPNSEAPAMRHAHIVALSLLSLVVAPVSLAEVIRWSGAGKNNHWENRDNWNPKRLPGHEDDVIIPGGKGEILITKGHTFVDDVPKPAVKKLKSLIIENSVAGQRTTIATSPSQPGMPSPLDLSPVSILIEVEGNIILGDGSSLVASATAGHPQIPIGGGSIGLTSTGGSLFLGTRTVLNAGSGANGPVEGGLAQRGAGGNVQIDVKQSILAASSTISSGGADGFVGQGSAAGGTVSLIAREGAVALVKSTLQSGSSLLGQGGSIHISAAGDVTIDNMSRIYAGASLGQGLGQAGGLAIVTNGKLKIAGSLLGGLGPGGGGVVLYAGDLENTGTVTGGEGLFPEGAGGNVTITTVANPPTRHGRLYGGTGRPRGSVVLNSKRLALADPIRAGSIIVQATGDTDTLPTITLLDGAFLEADTLICLDALGGQIDLSAISTDAPIIRVAPGGVANLVGDVLVDDGVALDSMIQGFFAQSDASCVVQSCLADLNLDGKVDAADLELLLMTWGADFPFADLDADGVVASADLSLLLAAWGLCQG